MNPYDFARFEDFVTRSLDNLIWTDVQNLDVFNERDMHSSAYFHIREYCGDVDHSTRYVRCEASIGRFRPDISVFHGGRLTHLVELKCFLNEGRPSFPAIESDLRKLRRLLRQFKTVTRGHFIMIYDDDQLVTYTKKDLEEFGYPGITFSSVNARRFETSERLRNGYKSWRREFDRLQALHASYVRR